MFENGRKILTCIKNDERNSWQIYELAQSRYKSLTLKMFYRGSNNMRKKGYIFKMDV